MSFLIRMTVCAVAGHDWYWRKTYRVCDSCGKLERI